MYSYQINWIIGNWIILFSFNLVWLVQRVFMGQMHDSKGFLFLYCGDPLRNDKMNALEVANPQDWYFWSIQKDLFIWTNLFKN